MALSREASGSTDVVAVAAVVAVRAALVIAAMLPLGLGCWDPNPQPHPAIGVDDAGVAEVWTGTTPLFGRCGNDRTCALAPGVVCLTTFPGGLCSHRCNAASDCEATDSRCVDNVCVPNCRPGRGDCEKYGGACEKYSSPTGLPRCVPACYAADRFPAAARSCVSGTTCDEWANGCFSKPNTTGAENGAACADDLDCRGGRCLVEGFPDGYCFSWGVAPKTTDLVFGKPLPRSTCPAGSVAFPGTTFGEVAPCFRGCDTKADCRAGYICDHLGTPGYATGYCTPLNCAADGLCPSGYHCVVADGGIDGACAK